MVARRVAGEPLQYVIGWAPFGRLRLAVGPGVFVPRPETEGLADRAATRLRAAPEPPDRGRPVHRVGGDRLLPGQRGPRDPGPGHRARPGGAGLGQGQRRPLRGGAARRRPGRPPAAPSWPGGSTWSAPTSRTCPARPSPPCRPTSATTSRACPWTAAPTAWTCSGAWPSGPGTGWPPGAGSTARSARTRPSEAAAMLTGGRAGRGGRPPGPGRPRPDRRRDPPVTQDRP